MGMTKQFKPTIKADQAIADAVAKRPVNFSGQREPLIRIFRDNPTIKVVDHFAGGGGASSGVAAALAKLGLDREPDVAINHDPEAIAMHKANHPETRHYIEDIWKVDPRDALAEIGGEKIGLLWASPTCFPAGTLVFTRRGLEPIESVVVGDEVLTHKSRWRKVVSTISKQAETVEVRGQGHYGLVTTPDHPFYSKRVTRRWPRPRNAGQKQMVRELVENPYWPAAESMEGKLWATPTRFAEADIPICATASFSDEFFYFVGRWLGDGFTSKGDVIICTGADDFPVMCTTFGCQPLRDERDNIVKPRVQSAEAAAPKLVWGNAALARWLEDNFGAGCENKHLPAWALSMQESWRRALLDGYVDADGHQAGGVTSTTSVSKALSVGIRLLVASLGFAPSMYQVEGRAGQIEGRTFVGRDSYRVDWRENNQKETTFRDSTHMFSLVKEVTQTGRSETVYCLQVDEDESYVADGIVVHNCTHFSKAKGTALDDSSIKIRGLCWVITRWAATVDIDVICAENVEEFQKFGPLHRRHTDGCSAEYAERNGKRLQKVAKSLKGASKTTIARALKGVPLKQVLKGEPVCKKGCKLHKPIKEKEGSLYRAFIRRLEKLGYVVETRVLRACDYGAPTTRKRWFMVARKDGKPIVWPAPTHGPAGSGLLPFRTAAECIDWTIPCRSIFDRPKPLADKTLARIARGVEKFVLNTQKPFIVPVAYGAKSDGDDRSANIDAPLSTVCGNRGGHALVEPIIFKAKTYGGGGNEAKSAGEPLGTVTCSKRGEHAVAAPVMVRTAHGEVDAKGKKRGQGAHSVEEPLGTVCASSKDFAIAMPYLVHRSNGERPEVVRPDGTIIKGQEPRIYDAQKPLGTVVAQGIKHALSMAYLVKNNGGNNDRNGNMSGQTLDRPVDTIACRDQKSLAVAHLVRYNGDRVGAERVADVEEPLRTVDTSNRFGLVASHLTKLRGTSDAHVEASAHSLEEPLPTVSAGGTHFAQVAAYLVQYNGQSESHSVENPIGSVTTRDRFGLVDVKLAKDVCEAALRVAKFLGYDKPLVVVIGGEQWVIVDIGMRMLVARELFNAQSFDPDYQIDYDADGNKFTETAKIRMCGNSVPPVLAEALATAQLEAA